MFGMVPSVWATKERLFVVDVQIPVVRVYNRDGDHLFDVGREGQGPGEFTRPTGVAVRRNDDILVIEDSAQIEVFAPDGTPKATWNTGSPFQNSTPEMLILGTAAAAWVPIIDMETRSFGRGNGAGIPGGEEVARAGQTSAPLHMQEQPAMIFSAEPPRILRLRTRMGRPKLARAAPSG